MSKNCIVAQSGGPTAAINASLAGVVAAARDFGIYDNPDDLLLHHHQNNL